MTVRIAYISDERFPYWGTDTQQIVKNAEALALAGAQVDLLIPPRWVGGTLRPRDQVAAIRAHYGRADRLGIRVVPGLPSSRARLEKAVHGLTAPLLAALGRYDACYTRNVQPTLLTLALGRPTFFENHRILRAHYPVSYRLMKRAVGHPRLAGVITNCDYVSRSYAEMGVPAERLLTAHLGYDERDFAPALDRQEARRTLGWPLDRTTVVYTGFVTANKGIEAIHALAGRLPQMDFRVVGGTEAEVARLAGQAQAAGLANVYHSPFVDIAEVPRRLFAADALLVPPSAGPLQRFGNTVLPMKIYTYLAAGRPIIAPALDDIAEVLTDGENAVLVPPDDIAAAAERVARALADPARAATLAQRAAELAPQYSWRNRGRRLLDFIQQRLAEG